MKPRAADTQSDREKARTQQVERLKVLRDQNRAAMEAERREKRLALDAEIEALTLELRDVHAKMDQS